MCQAATTTAIYYNKEIGHGCYIVVRTVSGGLEGYVYASTPLAGFYLWLSSCLGCALKEFSCFCTRYFVLAPPSANSPESSHASTVPLSQIDVNQ